MAEQATSSSSTSPLSDDELPLRLIKSESIPPSPNRSESSIDWLPEYSGLSWIAYGASSLLVISHFPSPQQQTLTSPAFRQTIELSSDASSQVRAVAWSPATPSQGDVAAAVGNFVCIFSDTSPNTQASFYWIRVAVLVQSHDIEAIKWTVSGDGIVSAGREVVFWRRNSTLWEIAWKFMPQQPQTMLSTTRGLVATAGPLVKNVESRNVLVCQMDHKAGMVKSDLLTHPQSVSMIQWRPTVSQRAVLLTCCLDGTVRLWSEIDDGRAKSTNRYFHVIAVVEINKSLNGTPGVDMFVAWATEIRSVADGRVNFPSATKGSVNDTPGMCEWLIGYGPRRLLCFWAIHYLDDISPLRFPRVSLWKTLDLSESEGHLLQASNNLNIKEQSLFIKAVISRSQLNGPPTMCSLFQLSDNSLGWSQAYSHESTSNIKDECLSLDGHNGNILQLAIHPYSYEIELAVSLDSSGFLLFWCISTISSFIPEMPALVAPTWKLVGKIATKRLFSVEYTCLRWAPSVLHNYSVLLLGHSSGIDCLMIEIAESEPKRTVHHKLCTIPFTGHNCVDGPTNIFAIPLSSTCRKTFSSNHFMLLGVWMNGFQVLSWKVTLHSDDLLGPNCDCKSEFTGGVVEHDTCRYESSFAGKRYSVVAELCSSKLSDSHKHDQVTSLAVVSPGSLVPSVQQKWYSSNSLYSKSASYQMAVGYSDGSLRFWKSTCSKSSIPHSEPICLPWELVGMFIAHEGPVTAISLSCCGGKIATFSMEKFSDSFGTLCIWRPVRLINSGKFLLEDKISLNAAVVTLSWFSIGNGQLLLGVCLQNEMRVYAQRSFGSQMVGKYSELSETHIWYCISVGSTSPDVKDFVWGPGATPVLVHESYFTLYSRWSSHLDKEHQTIPYVRCSTDNSTNYIGGTATDPVCVVFTDCNPCSINDQPLNGKSKKCKPQLPSKLNIAIDYPVCYLFRTKVQQTDSCTIKGPRTLLEVAAKSRGSLPSYHPDVLLLNLYSGNWKQACVAVRHLVECLNLDRTSVQNNKAHNSKIVNHVIPLMLLSTYFEEPASAGLGKRGLLWGNNDSVFSSAAQSQINSSSFAAYNADANDSYDTFSSGSGKSEISGFIETIEKFSDITAITNAERTQMLALIDLLGEISDSNSASAYENLDEPGRRFWVALRFQQLHFRRQFGTLASTNELVVDSGMTAWAFQSDCQDNLLTSFLSNEPSWNEMRNLGVGFWFTNVTQLRTRMEKLARSQFLKKRDPKDCALLYIALNRIQVLAGLFKMSRDEKDKPLVGFLSRNFQDEKNKSAALKNAYVLMGRHQLELAIAFFLLGGDTSSAISVCARTLGDEQLALVICRLLEGNGGSLERQIINKSLLPAVIERGDCWLASLFEWNLGNYFQSFLRLLGFEKELVLNKSVLRSNQIAFLDPTVGQYCLILATRNFMRNYVGESAAAVLAKWAALMTSIALNRRGLPIESLRCMSSSVSTLEGKDGGSVVDLEKLDIPHGILEESNDTSNWLHGDVAAHMESRDKLDLALHYVSNLIVEHPSWIDSTVLCCKLLVCDEEETSGEYKLSLEKFQHKLNTGFAIFEQRYSLNPVDMLNMIIVFSCNNGTLLLGCHILHGYSSQEFLQDDNHKLDSIFWYPPLPQLFLKATQEISCFFARYLMCFSMTYSPPKQSLPVCRPFGAIQSHRLHMWDVYMKRCIHLLEGFKVTLRMYCPNFFTESIVKKTFTTVDLLKYYIIFTSAWLQKNLRGLILTIYPILIASKDQNTPSNIDIEYLRKHLCQNADVITYNSYHDNIGGVSVMCKQSGHERSGELVVSIPEDEKWQIVGACLWRHLFNFTRDLMKSFSDHQTNNSSLRSPVKIPPSLYADGSDETGAKFMIEEFMHVPELFSKVLDNTLECIASSHSKHFASVITPKMEKRFRDPTLAWLVKSDSSHSRSSFNIQKQDIDNLCQMSNGDEGSLFGVLWDMSVDPIEICKAFSQNSKSWLHSSIREFPKGWNDVHKDILIEYETGNTSNHDHERNLSNSAHGESGSPRERRPQDNSGFMRPRQKESALVKVDTYFRNPMEIYKRNGELLETMCVNSINQQQAAVATNKKGILFFEWKDEDVSKETSEYIWSEVDWPQDGWAGSESTPLPTFVSPGIGLGSQKGTHLGLVGATVGRGSFTKSGTNLTDDRTFGILGYSGAGASGLGWGTQEDLEFVDSPATVDNISTRALSSHPSRPFFLAGSSNTHIYLWEFGKKKATATYGVLPAATVPPPYALASIEALQFDHYGQRFVTAALDGTVCTWQLEVGGRSNIHPTESSLCFDRHALDVTYIAASGSVVAAAGYSSDDVNVVVWDTLAPTTTSQASLICHEGGARSVSVFDNNIGSGSISPLIVTGGKGGDVGLHDFRFIATGKTKRNKHHNKNEQSTKYSSTHETHSGDSNKLGEQNLKGMLWYIPKAHSGSITKIATIPDTSFFLTGSKDGDVKLWDAKKAELVFHWPKLHERHTFLQPSSRGFGGIVRAAITDIQVFSKGFLTCGGDGTVKLVQIKDFYT